MKISRSVIAAAVIVALPLSAFAGDKDKMQQPMGATSSAEFKSLDTNSDGRISRNEASRDSKIEFTSADTNADGFIDSTEFAHRGMTNDGTMSPGASSTDPAAPPRQ